MISCDPEKSEETLGPISTPLRTFSYSSVVIASEKNTPITEISPIIKPSEATLEYSVSPDLPLGLVLDTTTGKISGSPPR